MERRKQFYGVAVDAKQGFISFSKSEDKFNILKEITERLGAFGISVENIRKSSSIENGARCATIQICVQYKDEERVSDAVAAICADHADLRVCSELDLCKVTLVGCDESGNVAASLKAIECLESDGIEIKSVRTGDLAISCLVSKSEALTAARLIHEEFQLANEFDNINTEELSLIA